MQANKRTALQQSAAKTNALRKMSKNMVWFATFSLIFLQFSALFCCDGCAPEREWLAALYSVSFGFWVICTWKVILSYFASFFSLSLSLCISHFLFTQYSSRQVLLVPVSATNISKVRIENSRFSVPTHSHTHIFHHISLCPPAAFGRVGKFLFYYRSLIFYPLTPSLPPRHEHHLSLASVCVGGGGWRFNFFCNASSTLSSCFLVRFVITAEFVPCDAMTGRQMDAACDFVGASACIWILLRSSSSPAELQSFFLAYLFFVAGNVWTHRIIQSLQHLQPPSCCLQCQWSFFSGNVLLLVMVWVLYVVVVLLFAASSSSIPFRAVFVFYLFPFVCILLRNLRCHCCPYIYKLHHLQPIVCVAVFIQPTPPILSLSLSRSACSAFLFAPAFCAYRTIFPRGYIKHTHSKIRGAAQRSWEARSLGSAHTLLSPCFIACLFRDFSISSEWCYRTFPLSTVRRQPQKQQALLCTGRFFPPHCWVVVHTLVFSLTSNWNALKLCHRRLKLLQSVGLPFLPADACPCYRILEPFHSCWLLRMLHCHLHAVVLHLSRARSVKMVFSAVRLFHRRDERQTEGSYVLHLCHGTNIARMPWNTNRHTDDTKIEFYICFIVSISPANRNPLFRPRALLLESASVDSRRRSELYVRQSIELGIALVRYLGKLSRSILLQLIAELNYVPNNDFAWPKWIFIVWKMQEMRFPN